MSFLNVPFKAKENKTPNNVYRHLSQTDGTKGPRNLDVMELSDDPSIDTPKALDKDWEEEGITSSLSEDLPPPKKDKPKKKPKPPVEDSEESDEEPKKRPKKSYKIENINDYGHKRKIDDNAGFNNRDNMNAGNVPNIINVPINEYRRLLLINEYRM